MQSSTNKTTKEKYKICPNCDNFTIFSEKMVYCIVCGEEMIDKCPSCKEEIIYPTLIFCPVCGMKLKNDNHKL
jgi:predicted amidophosphoribosyltransferase